VTTPEGLAQAQLDTFNAHDLAAFLPAFADDVEIIDLLDGSVILRGIDAFRERYAAVFRDRPRVHAELVGRLVLGRYVVDQERLTDGDEQPPEAALAIYEVDGPQIVRMWFLTPHDRQ
jgi:hypothetical protein